MSTFLILSVAFGTTLLNGESSESSESFESSESSDSPNFPHSPNPPNSPVHSTKPPSFPPSSTVNPWTPIFECVAIPGSEVNFYALDLEDIQSLIVESDAQSVLISGISGDNHIEFEYINTDTNILHQTILRGLPISAIDYDTKDWSTKKSHAQFITKHEDCAPNAYIPNVWFTACGNPDGLHIVRNGSNSLCAFKESATNSISSTITIYIDATPGLPILQNEAETTVWDNLDEMEQTVKETFPDISLISSEEYTELIADHQELSVCLIDTRSFDEYEIGRIENAINISIAMITDGTLRDTDVLNILFEECGADLNEFVFVTYCTLGLRAGYMATYLIDSLELDPANVFVIAKAMAVWANERRPMVNEDGYTSMMHTYSNEVGRNYVLPEYRYCCE